MLLPTSINVREQANFSQKDDRFLPVEVVVMHNGYNRNGSYFSDEDIKRAEWSLKDIPIRGFIKSNEDGDLDFDNHNISVVSHNNTIKIEQLCQSLGNIPATNNLRYIDKETNSGLKTYVVVDGYLWTRYLNDGYDILMSSGTKSVSMEIEIDDGIYNDEDGTFHITDYRYLGVVILGDDVMPGMEGARITIAGDEIGNYSEKKEEKENMGNKNKYDSEVEEEIKEEQLQGEEIKEEQVEEPELEVTPEVKSEEDNTEEVTPEEAEVEESKDEKLVPKVTNKVKHIDALELAEKVKAMESELNELRVYKEKAEAEKIEQEKEVRQAQIDELFNHYSKFNVDLSKLKDDVGEKSIDDIKAEIALALVDSLDSKFSSKKDQPNIADNDNFNIVEDIEQREDNPYGKFGLKLTKRS